MRLHEHFKDLDKQVHELEDTIVQWHRECAVSQKLAQLPGIGPLTASALVASIGDAKNFKNGRQLAAWLGPKAAFQRWQTNVAGDQQAR